MIAALATWLAGKGVAQALARPLAWAAVIALVVALLATAKCAYDRNLIAGHDARQSAEAVKDNAAANEQAAIERRGDDTRLVKEREELEDARAAETDADRRRARGCAILRQQGRDTSGIPQCGGPDR